MLRMVRTVAINKKTSETMYGPFLSVCLYFFTVGCCPLSWATLTDGMLSSAGPAWSGCVVTGTACSPSVGESNVNEDGTGDVKGNVEV